MKKKQIPEDVDDKLYLLDNRKMDKFLDGTLDRGFEKELKKLFKKELKAIGPDEAKKTAFIKEHLKSFKAIGAFIRDHATPLGQG
jgi:hypothetical protein